MGKRWKDRLAASGSWNSAGITRSVEIAESDQYSVVMTAASGKAKEVRMRDLIFKMNASAGGGLCLSNPSLLNPGSACGRSGEMISVRDPRKALRVQNASPMIVRYWKCHP